MEFIGATVIVLAVLGGLASAFWMAHREGEKRHKAELRLQKTELDLDTRTKERDLREKERDEVLTQYADLWSRYNAAVDGATEGMSDADLRRSLNGLSRPSDELLEPDWNTDPRPGSG